LRPGIREIEDRESSVPEPDIPINIDPPPIQPPVRERVRDPVERVTIHRRSIETDNASDSTHSKRRKDSASE
jgi:hypothetical protein